MTTARSPHLVYEGWAITPLEEGSPGRGMNWGQEALCPGNWADSERGGAARLLEGGSRQQTPLLLCVSGVEILAQLRYMFFQSLQNIIFRSFSFPCFHAPCLH